MPLHSMSFGSPFRSAPPPPLAPAVPGSGAAAAPQFQAGDPTGRGLILVIDDSAMVLAVVGKALRSQGYTTITVPSGVQGILTWEKHKAAVNLVLSDVFMPGMDGLSLARELRNRKCTRPIILMSSKLDDNSRWIAEEAGFRLLQKPFKDAELTDLVASLLA